jgi:hypothetical protein
MMAAQILQIANRPSYYLVPSASDPEKMHEVHARSGACDCEAWIWRHSRDYTLCRHGKALKAYLEAQAACPACGGRGCHISRFRYADDGEPLPCSTCDGSGKRADADPRLLAVADAYRDEQNLRELFR